MPASAISASHIAGRVYGDSVRTEWPAISIRHLPSGIRHLPFGINMRDMITAAHFLLYSSQADADRAFLKNVLQFAHVDAGHGWLIFRLPPAEIAVHPADTSFAHEEGP